MTWSKLSDDFFRHPKIVAAGKDARDLYMAALCHCNEHLTDGFVDAKFLRQLGAAADIDDVKRAAALLESVLVPEKSCLWEAVDGGWMVHDFLVHNLSKADHEKMRQDKADAGRRGGQRSGESRRGERPPLSPTKARNGTGNSHAEPEATSPAEALDEAPALTPDEAPASANAIADDVPFAETIDLASGQANGQAKTNPVSGSVSGPESGVPYPAAAAPPTSPPPDQSLPLRDDHPPGNFGFSDAAAAVAAYFSEQPKRPEEPVPEPDPPKPRSSGQTSSGMSALRSVLPAVGLPDQPGKPLLVLSSEEADARLLSHALQDCGVTRQAADHLVAEGLTAAHNFSWDDIRSQIEWLPHRNAHNPGHWLPKYIRDGWAKPKQLAEAERAAKAKQNRASASAAPPKAERDALTEARQQARQAYQAALTEAETVALEAAAEAAALNNSFARDYFKANGREGRSWPTYLSDARNKIIDERLALKQGC